MYKNQISGLKAIYWSVCVSVSVLGGLGEIANAQQGTLLVPFSGTKDIGPAHTTLRLPYEKNYIMLPLNSGSVVTQDGGQRVVVNKPINLHARKQTVIPMEQIRGQVSPTPVIPPGFDGGYLTNSHTYPTPQRCQSCPTSAAVVTPLSAQSLPSSAQPTYAAAPTPAPAPAATVIPEPTPAVPQYAPPAYTLQAPPVVSPSVLEPAREPASIEAPPIESPIEIPENVPTRVPATPNAPMTPSVLTTPNAPTTPAVPAMAPQPAPAESMDPYAQPTTSEVPTRGFSVRDSSSGRTHFQPVNQTPIQRSSTQGSVERMPLEPTTGPSAWQKETAPLPNALPQRDKENSEMAPPQVPGKEV